MANSTNYPKSGLCGDLNKAKESSLKSKVTAF